jgi:hypothetical protein
MDIIELAARYRAAIARNQAARADVEAANAAANAAFERALKASSAEHEARDSLLNAAVSPE